jgi:hypothetical protein
VAESTEEIVYGESVRAIDKQAAALDGLRARAGTLLSAAAVSTAFLGGQALARNQSLRLVSGQPHFESRLDWLAWLAIGSFVAVGALCVLILLGGRWRFALSARLLLEDHVDVEERNSPHQLHRFLAMTLEANWDRNELKTKRLYWYFRFAAICLAAEVLIWAIDLGRS